MGQIPALSTPECQEGVQNSEFMGLSLYTTSLVDINIMTQWRPDYKIKFLDNFLFQEYSYSTANMFTAVICALFFPDKFTITVFILFSMGFLFAGIYCYEKKTFRDPVDSNSCPSAKEKGVK